MLKLKVMRFILCLPILILGTLASCGRPPQDNSGPNVLSAAEKKEGWVLLFDGRSLKGWRGLGLKGLPSGHWIVEDGAIKNVPKSDVPRDRSGRLTANCDLATRQAFRDFELSFEWKISPAGNSGLKYNVSPELSARFGPELSGRGGAVGFEYSILDDERNPDARVGPHRAAAALYDTIPSVGAAPRPVGQYNTARVIFRGNHGEHWLNGARVLSYELVSAEFESRLAASKFRGVPGFAEKRRGFIVLQDHGDAVWFRNIKIRVLSAE